MATSFLKFHLFNYNQIGFYLSIKKAFFPTWEKKAKMVGEILVI